MAKTFTNTLTRVDFFKVTRTRTRGKKLNWEQKGACCDQVKMKTNSMCSLDLCESVSFYFIGSIQSGPKQMG